MSFWETAPLPGSTGPPRSVQTGWKTAARKPWRNRASRSAAARRYPCCPWGGRRLSSGPWSRSWILIRWPGSGPGHTWGPGWSPPTDRTGGGRTGSREAARNTASSRSRGTGCGRRWCAVCPWPWRRKRSDGGGFRSDSGTGRWSESSPVPRGRAGPWAATRGGLITRWAAATRTRAVGATRLSICPRARQRSDRRGRSCTGARSSGRWTWWWESCGTYRSTGGIETPITAGTPERR